MIFGGRESDTNDLMVCCPQTTKSFCAKHLQHYYSSRSQTDPKQNDKTVALSLKSALHETHTHTHCAWNTGNSKPQAT